MKHKQQEVITKLAELEVIKRKLKKDFVGIDEQIDNIVDSIRTWYCFPNALNKPLIVNLWGITGTFKTSVIRKLVELLGMNNRYREIDARVLLSKKFHEAIGIENTGRAETLPNENKVILIDEFQNIKTIGMFGEDTKESKNLYELFAVLSDGQLKYPRSSFGLDRVQTVMKNIKDYPERVLKELKEKADVQNDLILSRLERQLKREKKPAIEGFPISLNEVTDPISIPSDEVYTISEAFWDKNYYSLEDFQELGYEKITSFGNDHAALFNFCISVISKLEANITIDVRKTLIFVAGNLDNIFDGLTDNLDNDYISPDEFYEITKQVNFNDVKACLLEKFRPEQVARLGTNHVVFPSFNSKMYKKLIKNLNKRTLRNFTNQGIEITIDKSVEEFLLIHGAMPSQGARSILSSHEFVVDSNMSELIALAVLNGSKKASMSIENNLLVLRSKKDKVVKDISIIDTKILENYPEALSKVITTHEVGHALAVIALTGKYPDMIKVRSSDGNVGGYVKYTPEPLPNKQDMKHRLAIAMAGYAAEYIFHGPDQVSVGASSDILSATQTASAMIRVLGLGDRMSAAGFSMNRDGLALNELDLIGEQVDDMISEAFTLACTVLEFYKKEHKILSNALKTKVTMKGEEIKKVLKM